MCYVMWGVLHVVSWMFCTIMVFGRASNFNHLFGEERAESTVTSLLHLGARTATRIPVTCWCLNVNSKLQENEGRKKRTTSKYSSSILHLPPNQYASGKWRSGLGSPIRGWLLLAGVRSNFYPTKNPFLLRCAKPFTTSHHLPSTSSHFQLSWSP